MAMVLHLRGAAVGRELPRPSWTVALLWILAVLLWAATAAGVVLLALRVPPDTPDSFWVYLGVAVVGVLLLGAIALGLALVLKYTFSTAASVKLTERALREVLQKMEIAQQGPGIAGAGHEEVVSLLSEIMENTLLDEDDKAAKRQLAKKHRQQTLRREIEALIKAGKYREAHERLEEFRTRYAQSDEVRQMEEQLTQALREHEQKEITNITEQVERYMGLGLWERALETAQALAEQFPENPDAARLPETVRMEQGANRRQEQQRLYREIEHLVGRKHWREALRAAETLLANHPDSPEAKALGEQMDELRRNAAIMERREWEERITRHIQVGRHREAYDLATELMSKYPDSPQAEQIRKNLDQLKARAGIRD
jgi:outer membrane protein assembly factor BamD (BamD/ComL family)